MVRSLRAGNEIAYATLFHEHYRPLSVFANKYLNDLDSSKELVQDLFVSMYENRKSLIINTSLKSYLYQAIKNRCLNHLKKIDVRREYQKQAAQNGESGESLEDQILLNELEHEIFKIIAQLSSKCQEVFTMSRVNGLRNQEIAAKLDISVRTVETHISNALKILREKLGDEHKI
jgi:RNA polymerase sigma-70 factor (ECF subfamily)